MKLISILIVGLSLAVTGVAWAGVDGKQIYEKACQACHSPATANALNSPAANNKSVWAARFKAANKAKGSEYKTAMAYLVGQVKKGKGAMPPGGMCDAALAKKCTDADYKAAIDFMRKP